MRYDEQNNDYIVGGGHEGYQVGRVAPSVHKQRDLGKLESEDFCECFV